MRLWTVHPIYLDTQGLTALWREGLLAKKVLSGLTKGYKNHPQLNRFINHPEPLKAINCYLYLIWKESVIRNYSFDSSKIVIIQEKTIAPIEVTMGQIQYEFSHIKNKLQKRAPEQFKKLKTETKIKSLPIFKVIPGGIESWEKLK